MATLDRLTKISPDMDSEAQRVSLPLPKFRCKWVANSEQWVEAANIPRRDLGPAFANITIRRGTPKLYRSKQRITSSTSEMPQRVHSSLGAHEQSDLPTISDRNAFDESFAHALNAALVTKRVKSHNLVHDGPADPDDEAAPLLVAEDSEQSRSRSNSLQPLSKIKPSLSICLWNEVCHTSQYTRPCTEILREVLEVRYPAPKPSG